MEPNPFEAASLVEAEAMKDVIPFLTERSVRFVLTNKGRLSRDLQKQYGDVLSETTDGVLAVEIKAEQENSHQNLFLETWSNRARFTVGWMWTLDADVLLYYFVNERVMYSIQFARLRRWAFHDLRIYDFPEKKQGKYIQKNDTWGRCVPIEVVGNEVGFNRYRFVGPHGNCADRPESPVTAIQQRLWK